MGNPTSFPTTALILSPIPLTYTWKCWRYGSSWGKASKTWEYTRFTWDPESTCAQCTRVSLSLLSLPSDSWITVNGANMFSGGALASNLSTAASTLWTSVTAVSSRAGVALAVLASASSSSATALGREPRRAPQEMGAVPLSNLVLSRR